MVHKNSRDINNFLVNKSNSIFLIWNMLFPFGIAIIVCGNCLLSIQKELPSTVKCFKYFLVVFLWKKYFSLNWNMTRTKWTKKSTKSPINQRVFLIKCNGIFSSSTQEKYRLWNFEERLCWFIHKELYFLHN